jgi:hypothetical protein
MFLTQECVVMRLPPSASYASSHHVVIAAIFRHRKERLLPTEAGLYSFEIAALMIQARLAP